nr:hypothetical protein [Tanacetum cinerariifolium]
KVSLMLEILSRRFFLKLNLSDHRSILMDLQGTLKGKWRYLIPAKPPIHNHVLIHNYQDLNTQYFRYSDGFKCFLAIKIGRYEHKFLASILLFLLLCDCDIIIPSPTMAHGVDCSYVEIRLQDTKRRMIATLELVNLRVSYHVDVCTRESSEFCIRHHDAQKDHATVRAKIEVLRSERLAYEQEGIQTREALARSEAYCRALEARVAVLETHAPRLEWQRQAADDLAIQHIMRTQALEARARDDTLEDTGSSS